jgi:hypothetical protein
MSKYSTSYISTTVSPAARPAQASRRGVVGWLVPQTQFRSRVLLIPQLEIVYSSSCLSPFEPDNLFRGAGEYEGVSGETVLASEPRLAIKSLLSPPISYNLLPLEQRMQVII